MIRASYRRTRFGWRWTCESHPKPVGRFFLRLGHSDAERACRLGLRDHLETEHADELED